MANDVCGSLFSQQQSKRIDEDGFASAGFTGQKVKAGSKLHDHVVNDGVIF